jgi:hypothetical protein
MNNINIDMKNKFRKTERAIVEQFTLTFIKEKNDHRTHVKTLNNKFKEWVNRYYNGNISTNKLNEYLKTKFTQKRISFGMIWENCDINNYEIEYTQNYFIKNEDKFKKNTLIFTCKKHHEFKLDMSQLGQVFRNIKISCSENKTFVKFNINEDTIEFDNIFFPNLVYYTSRFSQNSFYLDFYNTIDSIIKIEYEKYSEELPLNLPSFSSCIENNKSICCFDYTSNFYKIHIQKPCILKDDHNNLTSFAEHIVRKHVNNYLEYRFTNAFNEKFDYNELYNYVVNDSKDETTNVCLIRNIPISSKYIKYYYKEENNKYLPSVLIYNPFPFLQIFGCINIEPEIGFMSNYTNSFTLNKFIDLPYNQSFWKIPIHHNFELHKITCDIIIFKNTNINNELNLLTDECLNLRLKNITNITNSNQITSLKLIKFNLFQMRLNGVAILIIGKKSTGKSTLIKNLLDHINLCSKNEQFYIFDNDETDEKKYKYNNILKYDTQLDEISLDKIVHEQTKNKVSSTIVLKNQENLFKFRGFKDALLNSKHYHLSMIVSTIDCIKFSPFIRNNFDYVFIFRDDLVINKKKIYEYFCGMFPVYDIFDQYFTKYTKDYNALVIYNCKPTYNNFFDTVFWYNTKN